MHNKKNSAHFWMSAPTIQRALLPIPALRLTPDPEPVPDLEPMPALALILALPFMLRLIPAIIRDMITHWQLLAPNLGPMAHEPVLNPQLTQLIQSSVRNMITRWQPAQTESEQVKLETLVTAMTQTLSLSSVVGMCITILTANQFSPNPLAYPALGLLAMNFNNFINSFETLKDAMRNYAARNEHEQASAPAFAQ